MLILSTDTDAIEVVLGEAIVTRQLPCVASWRDLDTVGSGSFVPGRSRTTTNSTTTVDFVTSPATTDPQVARVIDYLSVYNNDTIGHEVLIKYDANGTEYIITHVHLSMGERLEYHDRQGFQVLLRNGAPKTCVLPGTPEVATDNVLYARSLAYDVVNNDTTANILYSIPGLSFPVEKNQRYWFRFFITFTSNNTTTGSRFTISTPNNFGSTTGLKFRSSYSASTTTRTFNDGINNVFDIPAASNTTSGATGCNTAEIEGFCIFNGSGLVVARFATEVAGPTATITAKAGSSVVWVPLT